MQWNFVNFKKLQKLKGKGKFLSSQWKPKLNMQHMISPRTTIRNRVWIRSHFLIIISMKSNVENMYARIDPQVV